MGQLHDPPRNRRRSIRLKDWDYTFPGSYFVTICTHRKRNIFDDPILRDIAENTWHRIPSQSHAKYATLDEWILMPNHLHGIIILSERDEDSALYLSSKQVKRGSIPSIVGNYKSLVTRRINKIRQRAGVLVWQRGYYERIGRNETELNAIRQYIRANPERWKDDRENLDAIISRME